MKNDLSILVSETISLYRSLELYEQQSSYNPNMPVREFMYAGKLYDKFIHSARLNRYGKKLLPLPLPKLVVFYNGTDEKEDETTLLLSDAFKEEIRQNVLHKYSGVNEKMDESRIQSEVEKIFRDADPDIEVKVRMININHGHNREMLSKCRPLGEYAWFVAQVRNNQADCSNTEDDKQTGICSAIDSAIDEIFRQTGYAFGSSMLCLKPADLLDIGIIGKRHLCAILEQYRYFFNLTGKRLDPFHMGVIIERPDTVGDFPVLYAIQPDCIRQDRIFRLLMVKPPHLIFVAVLQVNIPFP